MNKLEANISLLVITFFAGIQYVFLSNIPPDVSHFAFLTITNLIGLLITFVFLFGEMFRISKQQVFHSFILAVELFIFNILLLLGSSGLEPAVTSFVLAIYFVFVPICLILLKKKVQQTTLIGSAIMLLGLVLALGTDLTYFSDPRILFLLVADIVFALYIITIGQVCVKSNPAILAMGQMFFCFVLSFLGWLVEVIPDGQAFSLPVDATFWGSVIFISFFIRGLYSVVQIYAQRYISAMNTALIFSTEVVVTLLMSPVLFIMFGGAYEPITLFNVIGCVIIVCGVLYADGSVLPGLKKRFLRHD